MGGETNHPRVSGLNCYGGINMYGNDIGNIDIISVNTLAPNSGSNINCTANFIISGNLYAGSADEFYRGRNSTTLYVPRLDANGNSNGYYTLQFNRGILHNVVAHDP